MGSLRGVWLRVVNLSFARFDGKIAWNQAGRGPGEDRARPGEERASARVRTGECKGVRGRGRKTLVVGGHESVNWAKWYLLIIREIPPGLLQHVLTVLIFWSWVLLLPRFSPWSRSLRLIPWASVLLYGPLDIVWICCPQLAQHPCKNGTHSTCFYSTGGHTLKLRGAWIRLRFRRWEFRQQGFWSWEFRKQGYWRRGFRRQGKPTLGLSPRQRFQSQGQGKL